MINLFELKNMNSRVKPKYVKRSPSMYDRVFYDEADGEEKISGYYDVLKDVYEQHDGNNTFLYPYYKRIANNVNTRFMDEEFMWYGFIEDCSLEDIVACCMFLTNRDKVPTNISGSLSNIAPNLNDSEYNKTTVCMLRQCPNIFNEYTMAHNSLLYRTRDFQIIKNGCINPNILIRPSRDTKGVYLYTLPVQGYGNITIPVHELLGMTFLPKLYYNPNMFTYFHLDGDLSLNHFQNIGMTNV